MYFGILHSVLKIIIAAIIIHFSDSVRNFALVLSNIECIPYGNYVQQISCTFNKTPIAHMNIDIQMMKRVDDLRLDFIVHLERPTNSYILLRSLGIKTCDLFHKDIKNPILRAYKILLSRTGPLPEACPIRKDFHYQFRNMTLDAEDFPSFVPEASFKVIVILYDRKFMYLHTKTLGQIVHKQTKLKKRKYGKLQIKQQIN